MPAASGADSGSGRSARRLPRASCTQGEGASFPPGACHFPQYGEEYFKQLTAERLVTRIVKGFPRGSWEKEPGRRNEALDCRVYARAAAAIHGLDRFEERRWRRMEDVLTRTVEQNDAPHAPARPAVRSTARQVIHSGYMARQVGSSQHGHLPRQSAVEGNPVVWLGYARS
jgi:phage terminase large subunit GpA-like protein